MIYLQTEHPDYGWITHPNLASAMDEIQTTIENEALSPGEITITIRAVEMSQEEFDQLPETD